MTWGDTGKTAHQKSFQSTLPQGKWLPSVLFLVQRQYFNPHFRKGSDQVSDWQHAKGFDFNPHFRKGSDEDDAAIYQSILDFNPHFRKGSDLRSRLIHLPFPSFQSTLPQGKWRRWCSYLSEHLRFQSTLPQGKWLTQQINSLTVSVISIHTSAREVTLPQINKIRTENRFQSTLPQGKWLILDQLTFFDCKFQSTLPQGKWREWLDLIKGYRHFNPHFRKGSDSLRS